MSPSRPSQKTFLYVLPFQAKSAATKRPRVPARAKLGGHGNRCWNSFVDYDPLWRSIYLLKYKAFASKPTSDKGKLSREHEVQPTELSTPQEPESLQSSAESSERERRTIKYDDDIGAAPL